MMAWEIFQDLEDLNMKYEELQEKVIEWAKSKEIFEKSTPIKQIGKTQEELLETLHALIIYDLINLNGRILSSGMFSSDVIINRNKLASGIYFLRLKNETEQIIKKVNFH